MMTDTRKAMEMALEALSARTIAYSTAWLEQRTAAINALKAELAALKAQEPVAWLYTSHAGDAQAFTNEPPPRLKELCNPLYAAPHPLKHRMLSAKEIQDILDAVPDIGDKKAREWTICKFILSAAGAAPVPAQSVNAELVEALEPFVLFKSSDKYTQLNVQSDDITKARAALAKVKE